MPEPDGQTLPLEAALRAELPRIADEEGRIPPERDLAARFGVGRTRLRRALEQANDRMRARSNVSHHYDLTVDFYRLFLDEDLQYSCAFFERPDATLEEAQLAKKRRLIDKLALAPDFADRVLATLQREHVQPAAHARLPELPRPSLGQPVWEALLP